MSTTAQQHKAAYQTAFLSSLVYLFILLLLPTNIPPMFDDPDTGWHLAAGDLIRSLGHLPQHDSWSYTAGSTPWFNIAWLWDVLISAAYQHGGWFYVIAVNSIMFAGAVALIFAASFLRSGSGVAAFMATIAATTMIKTNIRSFQVSHFCIALLAFMLMRIVHGHASKRWLLLVPPLMVVWVNAHGAFMVAFFLLGVFALDALVAKNKSLFAALALTFAASLAACLINPYGIHIIDATLLTTSSDIKQFIIEWQPLSPALPNLLFNMYILIFIYFVAIRRTPLSIAEVIVASTWLVLGISSIRHLPIFAIVSAPMLAAGIAQALNNRKNNFTPSASAQKLDAMAQRLTGKTSIIYISAFIVLVSSTGMFCVKTPALYEAENLSPLPDLSEETAYLKGHAPNALLLNDYGLGGPLIFYTRGKIPVWIDGRAETAYPHMVIKDYVDFMAAAPGWQDIFQRYHMDGAIIRLKNTPLITRFDALAGWHRAFEGKTSAIYLRGKP